MLSIKTILLLALSAPVLANPLSPRQCVDECGSTCYYSSDIDAAVQQGCNYFESSETVGSGKYPHTYRDDEGFGFPDAGPYYEFPILSSYKVYTGGSPGPDRVIFNENCAYEGVITHTGAGGDDFLQCVAE